MEKSNKRPLDLDWNMLLDKKKDEPPPSMIIKKTADPLGPSSMTTDQSLREDFASMTDRELWESIKRQRNNVDKLGSTLPDKGEKLRAAVKALEEEGERRKLLRASMDVDECEQHRPLTSSGMIGASDGFGRESMSFQVDSQSHFTSLFTRRMEESTDCGVVNVFDRELSTLGHCDHKKMRSNGGLSPRGRKKGQSSLREWSFTFASGVSFSGDEHSPNNDEKGRVSSPRHLHHKGENLSRFFSRKKDACQVPPSNASRPRKGQTVVLVDEDDAQVVGTMEREVKLDESMKDAKIYYPSRDDPESVEICYTDINCLAPEVYLTSPIMNFYIRYLQRQASPRNRAICDCHFFNTFFYKKLKQAVSYKGCDKESFFAKFRRWWKGVNIFQKAYVLIPIHEDFHWSLVIICIPDKEDESKPIILHLDSLGLHRSRTVFGNIRRFLAEEWNYMKQEVVPSDIPISDRIWKRLPWKIDEQKIMVPQQKNDYDCGLFVLFFMERFIEEAPARLKKNNISLFGKRWFRPDEASCLRVKIRNLLLDEFQIASESSCISGSSPLATGAPT